MGGRARTKQPENIHGERRKMNSVVDVSAAHSRAGTDDVMLSHASSPPPYVYGESNCLWLLATMF